MQISLDIYVSGNVRQTISLEPDCSPQQFAEKIKNRELVTTIAYDGFGRIKILEISTNKIVGTIVNQECLDDVEIIDYEVVPEYE